MRTLVLLRHAHRDTFDVHDDNGLSGKGLEQSARVLSLFRGRFNTIDSREVRLLSSPKKRCQETIEPISEAIEHEVEIDPRLTEGGSMETTPMFVARVRAVLEEWVQGTAPLTILCSHGDWIPVALELLTGRRQEVPKAGWVEVTPGADGQLTTRLFRCD